MPTFKQVYDCLAKNGEITIFSSIGTEYIVNAYQMKNGKLTIRASPRSGHVNIHDDCWGCDKTCQGTWATGIYNGSYSIYDWYSDNCCAVGDENANT